MPLFDDDQDGFWATRFGMTPDDWRQAKDAAADAARSAYDADTRAVATSADPQPGDGAGVDKFQTAYRGQMAQQVAQRGAAQAPSAPPMTISDNGLDFIQQGEAYSPKVYVGQDHKPTVGWGHVLRPGEAYPDGIDIETAEKLHRSDVANAEAIVRRHVKVPLNQNQYDALVSLAYNAGNTPFGPGHDLGDALRRGDYAAAAQAFALYHRPHGSKAASGGLDNRRAAEAALFRRPTDH
jgi:lysozyme